MHASTGSCLYTVMHVHIPKKYAKDLKKKKKMLSFVGLCHFMIKALFSYVGKIPDNQGCHCFTTVPDLPD